MSSCREWRSELGCWCRHSRDRHTTQTVSRWAGIASDRLLMSAWCHLLNWHRTTTTSIRTCTARYLYIVIIIITITIKFILNLKKNNNDNINNTRALRERKPAKADTVSHCDGEWPCGVAAGAIAYMGTAGLNSSSSFFILVLISFVVT